jgi:5'-methylthioadenosine phosphorylase
MCYATIAMVTDYDVWHETEDAVTVEMVIANLKRNTENARQMIRALARAGLPARTCPCGNALQNAIVTAPEAITHDIRRRLGIIGARYLTPSE